MGSKFPITLPRQVLQAHEDDVGIEKCRDTAAQTMRFRATQFVVSLYLLQSRLNVIHIIGMQINFDEPKRLQNLTKHDLDFADIDIEYFAGSIVVPAKLDRFMAIGVLSGDVIATVFAKLGSQGVTVISMRRASRKERKAYEEYYAQKFQTH